MPIYLAPILLILSPGAAQAKPPTAAQVLQRCQQAYDSVRTLQQNTTATLGASKGTAQISFVRPGKLRVTGQSIFPGKYDLVADGRTTWVYNGNAWNQVQNAEMGIATITGISANAGTLVPATLLHTNWGGAIQTLRKTKATVKKAKLGGRDTYCVVGNTGAATKLWIDAKSFFLVKSEMSIMDNTIVVKFDPPKINQPIPDSRFKR
jgi:outer membrane lipoprotein-sorting protein